MAAGILPFIAPAVQTGIGLFQGFANLLGPKKQRPAAEIPESVREATANAERMASMTGLPGEELIKGQIDQSVASGLNTLKETQAGSQDIGASVVDLIGKKQEALTNLGVQSANYQAGVNQRLQAALGNQGQYEQANFEYNQMQPYNEYAAAKSAMSQASLSNLFSGISSMTGVGAYGSLGNGQNPNMGDANTAYNTANVASLMGQQNQQNMQGFYNQYAPYLQNFSLGQSIFQ